MFLYLFANTNHEYRIYGDINIEDLCLRSMWTGHVSIIFDVLLTDQHESIIENNRIYSPIIVDCGIG